MKKTERQTKEANFGWKKDLNSTVHNGFVVVKRRLFERKMVDSSIFRTSKLTKVRVNWIFYSFASPA